MPLTLGTAGHIDHGKTALVGALTGVDTDRLPEEKARGISIALGYAPLELRAGRVSVVDVPGHERFVRTMVAGATGIDLYLMVVAADDGVMPQTREHAAVLAALGVASGWSRSPRPTSRRPDAGRARRPPRCCRARRSSRCRRGRGDGLDALRAALTRAAARVASRIADGPLRLHVDRVFTVRGRGHGRHRHAVVGRRRAWRPRDRAPGRSRRRASARWRSTTSPSTAPRRASASR